MSYTVKVGNLPGPISEYAYETAKTVGEILADARITVGNESSVTFNNSPVTTASTISSSGNLLVTKKIKGA